MAELLGTVASAIAVAEAGLMLGQTVLKLKRLWEDVQEVPNTIRNLMMELEILEPILQETESHETIIPQLQSDRLARLSSSYCRAGLLELRTLVDSLSKDIDSKKRREKYIGRIKITLNKNSIGVAEVKLQRALALFHSSQINYLM